MPLREGASEVEDTRPTDSESECTDRTTDGAAELNRVIGGWSGASWLDGLVLGDTVNEGVDIFLVR